jgi:hypothetical protein
VCRSVPPATPARLVFRFFEVAGLGAPLGRRPEAAVVPARRRVNAVPGRRYTGSTAVSRWRTTTVSSITVFRYEVIHSATEVFYLPGQVEGVSRLVYVLDCDGVNGL